MKEMRFVFNINSSQHLGILTKRKARRARKGSRGPSQNERKKRGYLVSLVLFPSLDTTE
jgi:hypothetical protein